jgi:isopentenyl-diphosphate Delta-isomerase
MNKVVVVNEKDEVIGTMPKKEAHINGALHRIAVVYVENQKGEILVQHRADGFLDHSAAGHVDPGESYEEAARRELKEELGIKDINLKFVGHGNTKNEVYPGGTIASHSFDIFSCVAEPGELQTEEVSSVYWAKPEDVLSDMQIKTDQKKYCDGFIASLPILIRSKDK